MNRIQEKYPSPEPFSGICENPECIHKDSLIMGEYNKTIDEFYHPLFQDYRFHLLIEDGSYDSMLNVYRIFDPQLETLLKIVINKKAYSVCENIGFITGFEEHGIDVDEIFNKTFQKLEKSQPNLIEEYNNIANNICEIHEWYEDVEEFGYDLSQDLFDLNKKRLDSSLSITLKFIAIMQKDYFSYENSVAKDLSIIDDKIAFSWNPPKTAGAMTIYQDWLIDNNKLKKTPKIDWSKVQSKE